jgi:hypothetical protein
MPSRRFRFLTAACGILGTIALTVYFSAPFWLMPLPPPNATSAQIISFGTKYRTVILWDTWLQQAGSILSVLFALALVHFAGSSQTFAGKLVLLVSGVILALSLVEGTFILAALQSADNGHYEASVTSVDMASVFVHIFLLAPSLFLVLGFALWKTSILPPIFSVLALSLGLLFQVLGVAGLFSSTALLIVIFILLGQNLWTLAASVSLLFRKQKVG